MPRDLITPLSRRLRSPEAVQKFLRGHRYNREEKGETLRSANEALRRQSYHCLEACFIAAALLEKRDYPPLVLSFESHDLLDHVVYAFQFRGRWGAIGRSRNEGLHGRKAVFKNPRELARSYIEPYVDNLTSRIKGYALVDLSDCRADWRYSKKNLWSIEKYLCQYPHRKLDCPEAKYQKLRQRFCAGYMPDRQKYWL